MCKDGFSDLGLSAGIILRWTRPPYFEIRVCLFDLGLQVGMTVRKEPRHLLCDGTGDKPADVLFASFSQGRDLCVDVTVVNPLIDMYAKMQHEDNYLAEASSYIDI
jgi:hypothetical protein